MVGNLRAKKGDVPTKGILQRSLLLATSALGIGLAVPVSAEDLDAGAIVVTARRLEEHLRDVLVSMTVFSQGQITKRNIIVSADGTRPCADGH